LLHGAIGLAVVLTIAETAFNRKLANLTKGIYEPAGIPKMKLAKAWGIDGHTTQRH
jgi:hypothetical protein